LLCRAAEVDNFAVRQYARGTIREIVEGYHAAGLTVRGRRLRGDREPFVHRAAADIPLLFLSHPRTRPRTALANDS
jgi:hypothetical protein